MIEFNSMFGILALLIVVPLLVIIMIYLLAIKKEKKNDIQIYRFKRDFWGNIISLFYSSVIFSLSLGYAVNVILKIYEYSLQEKYLWLIIGVIVLVFFTFLFFVYVFVKYMKFIKNKDNYFTISKENEELVNA